MLKEKTLLVLEVKRLRHSSKELKTGKVVTEKEEDVDAVEIETVVVETVDVEVIDEEGVQERDIRVVEIVEAEMVGVEIEAMAR